MLKLNTNVVPTWDIDSSNTQYVLPSYIGYITNVTVDGSNVTAYTFLHDTVTVDVAPTTTITISYFSRQERDILGNGEVTMGDLIDEVYDEMGRKQYTKIYPKEKVRRDLNKTIGQIIDDVPERSRIQHYSFKGINWLKISAQWVTVNITTAASYPLDIEGSFLIWKWLYYNYFDYTWETFTVSWASLIWEDDRLIVWHKIPTGVERVSEVYVNWVKLEYTDSRDFYMDTRDRFTIIKDYQWQEYLYLPYSSTEYSCVVKFVPDYAITTVDEDILDIPYRYTRVFVYEVVYRLLASREDDRAPYYQNEFEKEYKKYKTYKAKATRKTKSKIWFAQTFGERNTMWYTEVLPNWIYDEYL